MLDANLVLAGSSQLLLYPVFLDCCAPLHIRLTVVPGSLPSYLKYMRKLMEEVILIKFVM